MNLMGKIFTLLIFFMSITFLVLAVMVGASHRNWKETAAANKDKAALAAARLEQTRATSNEFVRKLNAVQVSSQQQFAYLFSALNINKTRLEKEATANSALDSANSKLLAKNELDTQLLKDQEAEIARLKASNKSLIEDVATQREAVVSLTTQTYDLRGQVQALEESSQELSGLLAKKTRVMKAVGVNDTDLTDHIPKQLEGLVTKRSDAYIAVSLGTDDGLRVGHSLDVYRADRYVGRATVTRADHNISAARLLPEYERTLVREGDYVTTKF